ncbi:MAG: ATP-dependent protease ATPase subunit HslU [Phycisphaerae bacterium]|nr:ATP-dependent protease ATPase subunit HslU [Phycisphaerae bacterium]
MEQLTPRRIVAELDRYIVGQHDAKRAVAVAIRNRWRRQMLPEALRAEVGPKNILMIGPTGVGKTEIARRLAQIVNAPFLKVEATKFTEVGYHGRDVDMIIRDLLELAIAMVRAEQAEVVRQRAEELTEEALIDALLPAEPPSDTPEESARRHRTREKLRMQLREGRLDDREIELRLEQKAPPIGMFATTVGMDQLDPEIQNFMERLLPAQSKTRRLPIREARRVILQQESEKLIDREKLTEMAIARTENSGIVFLDEIDKLCGPSSSYGPDVSRQGVQRDLLPILEGGAVNTRHGPVRTNHILFIAAGAFHQSKPSDLMPELQGRLPIRVELGDLAREDFVRILTEPQNALLKQHAAMLETEGVKVQFSPDAVEAMAEIAVQVNRSAQNIGARRLYTITEKVLEEISFDAPDQSGRSITIDARYVRDRLAEIIRDEDLSRFIL